MNIYLVKIDLPCLSYGDIFLVKAKNKKSAQQKIYDSYKGIYNYKKKDIIVSLLTDIFKDSEDDIVEIH